MELRDTDQSSYQDHYSPNVNCRLQAPTLVHVIPPVIDQPTCKQKITTPISSNYKPSIACFKALPVI